MMNKTIKKRLLHFFTSGDIYEDFAAARAKKTAALRRVIRVCFYAHCAAAVLDTVLAAALGAGLGVIAVAICSVLLAGLAFLAAGDMTLIKTLLLCGDLAFAAAMFVTGALSGNGAPFFAAGAVSVGMALIAVCAFFAAAWKIFLEGFSPLAIRREHYTLLPNLGSDIADDVPDMPDIPEKPQIVLPPPRTEYQVLSDKLREILCKPLKKDEDIRENAEERSDAPTPLSSSLPQTEVTQ